MNNSEQPQWSDAPKQFVNEFLPDEMPIFEETILGKEEDKRGIDIRNIIAIMQKGRYEGPLEALDHTELACSFNGRFFRIEEDSFSFEVSINWRNKYLKASVFNRKDGKRSNHIFPKKLLQFFIRLSYTQISGMIGDWYPDDTDNTTQFLKALKSGMTEKEAALSTWTGKIAAESNFTDVVVEEDDGAYFVLFSKKKE